MAMQSGQSDQSGLEMGGQDTDTQNPSSQVEPALESHSHGELVPAVLVQCHHTDASALHSHGELVLDAPMTCYHDEQWAHAHAGQDAQARCPQGEKMVEVKHGFHVLMEARSQDAEVPRSCSHHEMMVEASPEHAWVTRYQHVCLLQTSS